MNRSRWLWLISLLAAGIIIFSIASVIYLQAGSLGSIADEVPAPVESMPVESMPPNQRPQSIEDAREQFLISQRQAEIAAEATIKRSQIVYNRPKSLPYDKPSMLFAVIASRSITDAQKRASSGKGEIRIASVDLAPRVRAELQGASSQVDIQLVGPPVKAVTGIQNATWTWYVTPHTTDKVELTLSFFNQVNVGNGNDEIDGPVFVDQFTIEASFWEKLLHWAKELGPSYALVAGALTTLYALIKWFRNLPGKPPLPTPPA